MGQTGLAYGLAFLSAYLSYEDGMKGFIEASGLAEVDFTVNR